MTTRAVDASIDPDFIIQAACEQAELVEALNGLRIGAECWCDHALGNPMYPSHSASCLAARDAVRKAEGR